MCPHRILSKVGPKIKAGKANSNLLDCVETCCIISGWFRTKETNRGLVNIWLRFIL